MYTQSGWFMRHYTSEKVLRIGENEDRLAKALAEAIPWSDNVLSSVQNNVESELSAAQGYTACLRKARELPPPSEVDRDLAVPGVAGLIRSYFDPLTTGSSPGETRLELVQFSVEAVLWLRAFLDTNPGPDGSSTSGNPPSQQILNHCIIDPLAEIMLDDLQIPWWSKEEPLKPSIVRILLWVWKNTPDTSIEDKEKYNISVSSCRLFAPPEKEVEFSQRGEFGRYDKPLPSDDSNRIVEFIEYTMEALRSSAFITRNADVAINCLYVYVNQHVDWKYELFDLREQRSLCSRSTYIESGLL
ncbi:hypothetical protein FRC04_002762 [Tulasnella sp. 424]|nr:hypothetical protein FRC04_002762 [Tulasnella sp. 424]